MLDDIKVEDAWEPRQPFILGQILPAPIEILYKLEDIFCHHSIPFNLSFFLMSQFSCSFPALLLPDETFELGENVSQSLASLCLFYLHAFTLLYIFCYFFSI